MSTGLTSTRTRIPPENSTLALAKLRAALGELVGDGRFPPRQPEPEAPDPERAP